MIADYLYCELMFQPDGIHLYHNRLSASEFYSRLSALSGSGAWPASKLAGVLADGGLVVERVFLLDQVSSTPPAKRPKGKLTTIEKRDAVVSQAQAFQFDPFAGENRIPVRHGRITYMAFEAKAPNNQPCGFRFVTPAFQLKAGSSAEDQARFSNVFICCDGRVAEVTYTPDANSAGKQYSYELRLQAQVYAPNNTASGHVIIIVDPIIGNEEV